jgi:thiol-disulfide isomerase/thioredoxin
MIPALPKPLFLLALATTILLMLVGCGERPSQESEGEATSSRTIAEDDLAKDFPIDLYRGEELLGGTSTSFKQVLEHEKPVVLNFWAALCPPCRAEMPDIQRVSEQYQDRVIFLGLDVGPFLLLGTGDQALHLLNLLKITYPSGSTERGQVIQDYEISSMPTTFFITPGGEIQRKWAGLLNEEKLVELVEELLEA